MSLVIISDYSKVVLVLLMSVIFFVMPDGAADCLDPDCCSSVACRDQGNCQMSPDPMEILLRKQPPSSTASFFERMKFLIEDDSVQSYGTLSSFNPRFEKNSHVTVLILINAI